MPYTHFIIGSSLACDAVPDLSGPEPWGTVIPERVTCPACIAALPEEAPYVQVWRDNPEAIDRLRAAIAALPLQSFTVLPTGNIVHGFTAADTIYPNDPIIIGADGRAYLADRDEAAQWTLATDAPPAAAGDVSLGSADDGPAPLIARAAP